MLIADDSRLIRRALANIVESQPDMQVVGEAQNGKEALESIPRLKPDVVTLDIEMPVMDGLTALKHIMMLCPKPIVMLSSLTYEGSKASFDALKLGAIDFIHKPSRLRGLSVEEQQQSIIRKIEYASQVEIDSLRYIRPKSSPASKVVPRDVNSSDRFVILGAAEGGFSALLNIVPHLHEKLPAVIMVMLYTSDQVADDFAQYLDSCSVMRVKRIQDGDAVKAGVCYLIAEDEYVTIAQEERTHAFKVTPSPFPHRRGAINMLMFSVAEHIKERTVGVILSGLGEDGAEGLREIDRLGGLCFAQKPQNCLYREMPQAALEICKTDHVMTDRHIVARINDLG